MEEEPIDEYVPPADLRTVEVFEPDPDLDPLTIPFGHTMPDPNGDVTFFAAMRMMDGQMMGLPFEQVTPVDALHAQVGQTRMIEVVNMTGGIHPYHLHGFFFQPLEIEYVDMDTPMHNLVVPAPRVEDKDTVLVPGRLGARGRSRTIWRGLVRFDDTGRQGQVAALGKTFTDDVSGGWMTHCHILEHADRGMMTFLQVTYPDE
jgi:FtsP/CotA-like multicopper oxidase with cupredoxin domain